MSAIEGVEPPMNGLPSRKNVRYTSSGSARAAWQAARPAAFTSSSASDAPTSPG